MTQPRVTADRPFLVPPRARDTRVRAAGGTWRVLTAGPDHAPATPVLLVHGGGADHAGISWFRALGDLSADRRVLAPDLPGFGATRGVEVLGAPARQARQLVALLDALDIDRVVAVGVSMGGDVVLNLALQYPERVRAVVPVAPGGLLPRFGGLPLHALTWLTTRLPDGLVMELTRLGSRAMPALLDRVAHVELIPAEVVEEFRENSATPWTAYGYWRYNKASIGPTAMRNDLTGRVRLIEAPALFLHSPDDPMVPIEGSRRAAASMPDARLVEVGGVLHWLPLEAPDRFRDEVLGFLAGRGL